MTPLRQALDDYLAIRRQLGFKLEVDGRLLERFVAFVDQSGESRVTTELALAWAKQPTGVNPHRFTQRLGIVRRFARYLATLDPDTDIPPIDLLPACQQRIAPYIYSPGEIAALISAAGVLSPPVRAATIGTVIGLLAATGMRVGEVLALDDTDVDREGGVITAVGKWGKQREVPVHPSTVAALREYQHTRERYRPTRSDRVVVHHQLRPAVDQGRVRRVIPRVDRGGRARRRRRARPAPPTRSAPCFCCPDADQLASLRRRYSPSAALALNVSRARLAGRHVLVPGGRPGAARARRPRSRPADRR